jgi:hypothetical protein
MWRYSYEMLGGFLIVFSSLVTEQMPDKLKKRAWIIFGIAALLYSGVGIYLDKQAAANEQTDRQERKEQNKEQTKELSSALEAVKTELEEVRRQNSAMLQFAANNFTSEQAKQMLQEFSKHQSTRELREREHELAKQLRKLATDHQSAIDAIARGCLEDRARSAGCGISAEHDANQDYERTLERDYRGQAENLRDAMLARLPPPVRPEQSRSAVEPDYLDELAAKLP